mmetsp:Transcript_70118/g.113881  ORF Transcript_70118/g.113881 Transcript_70118/m.113881 type:complete len:117 (+) Transcript_70118:137-487(+)
MLTPKEHLVLHGSVCSDSTWSLGSQGLEIDGRLPRERNPSASLPAPLNAAGKSTAQTSPTNVMSFGCFIPSMREELAKAKLDAHRESQQRFDAMGPVECDLCLERTAGTVFACGHW